MKMQGIHNTQQSGTNYTTTGSNPIFLQKKSEADFEDNVLRLFPWDEIKTLLHHIVALVQLDDILKMDFLLKLTNYVAI